ncbi:MAG: CoA ester lyase [Pseudomonadota bacterium]
MTHRWRSLLFVPGDSDRKIDKAQDSNADVLIYDLEDAVQPAARPAARMRVADAVSAAKDRLVQCVRINPLDSADAKDDLAAVMGASPDYIMLPKVRGANDIDELADMLDTLEAAHRIAPQTTQIIALVTETPQMTLNLPTVTTLNSRVAALTWGGEDLMAALQANRNKTVDGRWTATFELARTLCLLAARACGVRAIDTLYSDFRDHDGLVQHANTALADGFDGVMAIHPAQLDGIHSAFTPDADTIAHAQAVVEAFAANPHVGALQLDGRMLDRPHLLQAQRVLANADVKSN